MKCPNCGRRNTVTSINPKEDGKYDMHLYIPGMPKRKLYAKRYRCQADSYLGIGGSHIISHGCGCEWEENYKVTIEKLPIKIIKQTENK